MHTSAVQNLGLNDKGVLELMAVVDLFSGFNKLMDGLLGPHLVEMPLDLDFIKGWLGT